MNEKPDNTPRLEIVADDLEVIAHKSWRERRGRPRPRIALNITPMIDVVFLMLIYFMVATNFRMGEEVFLLDLPERGEAAFDDPFELDDEPLRITVISTGPGRQAFRLEIAGPHPQPRSFDDLRTFLRERQLRPDRPAGLFAPDHPIIIEPMAATRWEHVIGAFNAAVGAEYTNVTFGSSGSE